MATNNQIITLIKRVRRDGQVRVTVQPSLKDVARLAGVSHATASLALNNKPVGEQTRQRVLEAARKLNYVPQLKGKALATGHSRILGLFIVIQEELDPRERTFPFFYRILHGAFNVANTANYAIQFGMKTWAEVQREDFFTRKVKERLLDGMIVVPQWQESEAYFSGLDTDFPNVVINPSYDVRRYNTVSIDNYQGARAAAMHVAQKGYHDIGVFSGPVGHRDIEMMEKGILEVIAERGMRLNREWFVHTDSSMDEGYKFVKSLLAAGRKLPEAILCTCDYLAVGVLRGLLESGVRVPGDVAVMGYDDLEVAQACYPLLTTVRQPLVQAGEKAAERLIQLIQGGQHQADDGKGVTLVPELVVRDSC